MWQISLSKETMNQRAQTIRNDPIICNFCGTKGTKRNIKVYHGAAGEICKEKKGPVFKILDEANIPYNKTQKLSKLKHMQMQKIFGEKTKRTRKYKERTRKTKRTR
eukprot:633676_1